MPDVDTLELWRGDTLLGIIRDIPWTMFWSRARFEAREPFEEYRSLFEQEVQALDSGDMKTMEALQDEIDKLGLQLKSPDGAVTITEFMLHIDGREARLRC